MTDERREENTIVTGEDAGADDNGQEHSSEELTAKLKAAEDEIDGYRTQLTRLQADFVNFRRRIERERAEQARYANEQLLGKMLPVVDNLERAIEAGENAETVGPLLEGVRQVLKQFLDVLKKEGVTPLDPGIGQPFDPNYQEALMREEGEAEVVVEELLRGWRYHEKVLRPTLVKVGPRTDCANVTTEAKVSDEADNTTDKKEEKAETVGIKEVE